MARSPMNNYPYVKTIRVDERVNNAIIKGAKVRQMTQTEFIRYVLDCVLDDEGGLLK